MRVKFEQRMTFENRRDPIEFFMVDDLPYAPRVGDIFWFRGSLGESELVVEHVFYDYEDPDIGGPAYCVMFEQFDVSESISDDQQDWIDSFIARGFIPDDVYLASVGAEMLPRKS